MTKTFFAMTALVAAITGCQSTPRAELARQDLAARIVSDERDMNRLLLDAEYRTLLEIQDSIRMMLNMGNSAVFKECKIAWTEEQNKTVGNISTDIAVLLARYAMENTVSARDPVPMDAVLFGREVERIAQRRSALWVSLVDSNGLPVTTLSIFDHKSSPKR